MHFLSSIFIRPVQSISINFGTFRGFIRFVLAEIDYMFRFNSYDSELRPSSPRRYVFVCLGNINRSAFADVVAQSKGLNSISIGLSTTTGAPATETAIEVGDQYGVNLRNHRATNLTDYKYSEVDALFVMELRHIKRLLESGLPRESINVLGQWARPRRIHLHDPHTLSPDFHFTCMGLIFSAIVHIASLRE